MYTDSLDLNSLLRIDIERKERERLKQTLKKCQRLDYSRLPRSEKVNFDKFFVNQLREIQLNLTKRQENGEFIDMYEVFTQIMDIMETQIQHIETINKEMDSFKNTFMPTKQKTPQYKNSNSKTF